MPVDGALLSSQLQTATAVQLSVQTSRRCRIGNLASGPKADRDQLKAPDAARYKSMTPQMPSADRTMNKVSKFFRREVATCADV